MNGREQSGDEGNERETRKRTLMSRLLPRLNIFKLQDQKENITRLNSFLAIFKTDLNKLLRDGGTISTFFC